jgi:4-carboxymuconolactone decarboxylase
MTDQSDLPDDLATRADEVLRGRPNADLLAGMTADAFESSRLDRDTLVLVWLAALVALDAPPESFLMNLGSASQSGVRMEQVHSVLTALAPIVGTPRVVSATAKIMDLLDRRDR